MVYSSRFVLAVLVDGKIQKELHDGTVPIQFGREYALRFRNKNNRRAVVKFAIDGENVSGNGYIIPANDAIDIRRHFNKDATFRFVDLDSPEAVDHGKNGPNTDGSKGVIEAKFYLEKDYPVKVPYNIHHHHWHERRIEINPNPWPVPNTPCPYPYPMWSNGPTPGQSSGTTWCSTNTAGQSDCGIPSKINFTMPPQINLPPAVFPCLGTPAPLQEGCTVEGGRSGQTFTTEYIDLETDFTLLRCILKGLSNTVYAPTTAGEVYCTNCGAKKTRHADNFCGVCGKKF